MARRPSALDEAYRRYADVCFSVALYVLRSPDDAQDCVHDAILRVWQAGSYRLERGSLRAFLIACVRNEALSRRRATARRRAIDEREAMPEPTFEVDVFDHVEQARVRRALDALPREQKAALELAYFGGMSHTEIATALGEPLGTIKSRLALALRRLSRTLAEPQGAVS